MRPTLVSLSVFTCLIAITACADSTAPGSSAAVKAAPNRGSNTRYILASGDQPGPGCQELGSGLWLCDDGGDSRAAPADSAAAPGPTDNEDEGN